MGGNLFFPNDSSPLNAQGWITEFITPYLRRSGDRSDEASIFYDPVLTEKAFKKIKNTFKNDSEFKDFIAKRALIQNDKIVQMNGNFLDFIDTNIIYKDNTLTKEENEKYLKFMDRIKPHQIAFLQPYMRLSYGVKKKEGDKDYTFIDFPFNQTFDEDYVFKGREDFVRGEGCGIKNVNVNNDFDYITRINARISIDYFFANMNLLTREINANGKPITRQDNENGDFPYGFNFLKLLSNYNPSQEILRLEYGRKVSDGFVEFVDNVDYEIKSIIERRERKIHHLIKVAHSFNFNQNGSINLGVQYIQAPISTLLSTDNIFLPDPLEFPGNSFFLTRSKNLMEEKKALEAKIVEAQKQIPSEVSKQGEELKKLDKQNLQQIEKLKDANASIEEIRKYIRDNFITIILDKIQQNGQLFNINFNTTRNGDKFNINSKTYLVKPLDGTFLEIFDESQTYDINDFLNNKSNSQALKPKVEDLYKQLFNLPGNQTDDDKKKRFGNFMFFPLSALINAAFSLMPKDESRKTPTILLGNVRITIGDAIFSVNLGDLLVERDVFQKWYYRNVISKNITTYSYGAFISDVMNDLVNDIVYNNKAGGNLINSTMTANIKNTSFYLNEDFSEEEKRNLYLLDDIRALEDYGKRVSLSPDANHTIPMIYFSEQKSVVSGQPVAAVINNIQDFVYNEKEDLKRGVFHIKLGADSGMISNASFNATDSPIRSVFAYEAMSSNTARNGLVFYYSMNLTMLGNNMIPHNQLICLPFKYLGMLTTENDPGISGYYLASSTQDTIDSTLNYRTTVNCSWQYAPPSDRIKGDASATRIPDTLENKKIKDFLTPQISKTNFTSYINKKLNLDSDVKKTDEVKPTPASVKSPPSVVPPTPVQTPPTLVPAAPQKKKADAAVIRGYPEYKDAQDAFCIKKTSSTKCTPQNRNTLFVSEDDLKKAFKNSDAEIDVIVKRYNDGSLTKEQIYAKLDKNISDARGKSGYAPAAVASSIKLLERTKEYFKDL